jgi:hypothetical protein
VPAPRFGDNSRLFERREGGALAGEPAASWDVHKSLRNAAAISDFEGRITKSTTRVAAFDLAPSHALIQRAWMLSVPGVP